VGRGDDGARPVRVAVVARAPRLYGLRASWCPAAAEIGRKGTCARAECGPRLVAGGKAVGLGVLGVEEEDVYAA
jgi:hypothetical protein